MTDERESVYLAIDPGETIGWATFDEGGAMLTMGQSRFETFAKDFDSLIHSGLKHCITEQYRNYAFRNGQQQKRWSTNNTSKVIGKIELLCELRDVPITLQAANCKEIGAMWGGFEIPAKSGKNSIDHQFVAVAHGVYWLQKNGIRPIGMAFKER